MYLRFILYALIIYILYRLVFHFIIPIYKTTRQVKTQFREMHSRMQETMNQAANSTSADVKEPANSKKTSPKDIKGDYIEFEEVK
jgi:predicted Holliday junction resolvase-like endonuclease